MRLYETIQQAYLEAFKAKAGVRKDILGYMFAQLKSKQIDLQKELTDDEVMQYIKKEIKNRQESISYATTAGKTDDATVDAEKIQILETFLPKQFTADELTVLIKHTVAELGITDLQKQRGQLIGALMKSHSAQIDGKLLNDLISSL
jgi:uncharacterized protein YqeY